VVEPLLATLDQWAGVSPDHWAVADVARLAAVRADRAASAAQWFEMNAGQWDAIRSLHVAESEVEAAMASILGEAPVGRLVDIGTGTGRMIELLGPGTTSATGIDRSPEMLRFARARMGRAGIERVDLRQGDMYALPLDDGAADTIVLHQVLHYAQAPAAAIAEAARLLAPDGRLLIADFAAHDREDLRDREGHARLGFDDDQMAHWFAAAGLEPARTIELAGSELTVKLWLARRSAESFRLRAVR
jgi:ArsR family transcriptional regulator